MNQAVARLLAGKLSEGFVHPGDDKSPATVLVLPGFRTVGMPAPMAEQISDYATLIGEAIVATIEDDGNAIVSAAELAQIRERLDMTTPPAQHTIRVECAVCGTFMFSLNVAVDNPKINGPYFLTEMTKLTVDCPHTPQPPSPAGPP